MPKATWRFGLRSMMKVSACGNSSESRLAEASGAKIRSPFFIGQPAKSTSVVTIRGSARMLLGYQKGFLDAEMTETGAEIAAVTDLPLILDAACGWGDAMHMHRTIALAGAAGFAAIELEDQVYPKRAGHHVGHDGLVPVALMAAKVRAAAAVRRDPEFVIIARTNARGPDLDDALARAAAYRRAGADVLLVSPSLTNPAERLHTIGARLGPPLMLLAPPGGLATVDASLDELAQWGYRIVVDAMSIHLLLFETLQTAYARLAEPGFAIHGRELAAWTATLDALHDTIDLQALLATEQGRRLLADGE